MMNHTVKISNISILLLVLYPILYYYTSPFPFSWGEILLMFTVAANCINKGISRAFAFSKYYLLFWGWCAICLIINTSALKIIHFIPGGITMFIWSLYLGVLAPSFDFKIFYKYIKILFLILALLFAIQEISFLFLHNKLAFYIPISSMTANYREDLSFDVLMTLHKNSERFSTLFMEPAYFAEFLLVFLCVELFNEKNKNKLYTPLSIMAILVLIFMRSGIGILGVTFLLFIKFLTYLSFRKKTHWLSLLVVLPLAFFSIQFYINSEIGSSIMERQIELTDQTGSGYDRSIRGFYYFEGLSTIQKMIGSDITSLKSITSINGHDVDNEGMLFNGFQTVLVLRGIIGAFLLILFYYKLYRNAPLLSKSLILLLLLISLVESIFLMPFMLLISVICIGYKREYQIVER